MKISTRFIAVLLACLAALTLLVFALARSGLYNFAADDPHYRPVYDAIEYLRKRSVSVRAAGISVPPLDDHGRLPKGAGNYQAMCAQCHLSPGAPATEISRGLYPAPPNLAKEQVGAAEAFWTIKHGIKASGMPAWGRSMTDEDIWSLVALIRKLPTMDVKTYRELVENSDGHSHSGVPTAAPSDMRAQAAVTCARSTSNGSTHAHERGEEHPAGK
jgi:mono/diheme cytochrome c family protein